MNALSQCSIRPARAAALLMAGIFVPALGACAHDGLDEVKHTATTAYHAGQPAAPQPSQGMTAPSPPPRQ